MPSLTRPQKRLLIALAASLGYLAAHALIDTRWAEVVWMAYLPLMILGFLPAHYGAWMAGGRYVGFALGMAVSIAVQVYVLLLVCDRPRR